MGIRLLTIWDVDKNGNPAGKYREQYLGDYFERYKSLTEAMKVKCPEWKELRIGFILDDRTGRAAVFRQLVKSRDDYRPTDILMGLGGPKAGEDVLQAGSTEPQFAIPSVPQVSCYICDFTVRDLTAEEKELIADSRRELAHAKEGIKNIGESVLAENAELDKEDTAPVKANEAPSDMLTICESAKYARVNERTIRNWLKKVNGDGSPMLAGVIGKGRFTRIPRQSLQPFRNQVKAARKKRPPALKRPPQKAVKRKR